MDVECTGRQTTITKKLKLQAEAGLAQIAKIVGNSGSVHVILSADKYRQIADVTVQTRHQKLVARCEATEMAIALRDALVKIEQQAIRHKKKFGTIKRHPKADVKGAKQEVAVNGTRRPNVAVKDLRSGEQCRCSSVLRESWFRFVWASDATGEDCWRA